MEEPLILERYRPLGILGEGGYGSVELAWDTRIQRRVAIKRIALPKSMQGEATLPPGLIEARTAAMLSHPNIVQVIDFDNDADEAFLIMEYVEGVSLGRLLEDEDALTIDEVAAIATAVAEALIFAHDNGVLHLDIKPDNILIDSRGVIKVADFGIATISSAIGFKNTYAGTLGWMPCEQLSSGVLDARTDQWAFANVLFNALSGENLYAATSLKESFAKAEAPYKTPITSLRSDLDAGLDDIFECALDCDPSLRFEQTSEFANEILEHLGDPQEGQASLAELVSQYLSEEEPAQEEFTSSDGFWGRIPAKVLTAFLRFFGTIGAAFLSWLGLRTLTSVEPIALLVIIAVVALACIIAPNLGILLATIAAAIGLFVLGSWPLGVGLCVGMGLCWFFFIRSHAKTAAVSLLGPAAQTSYLSPFIPLLAGFSLSPLKATMAGLAASFLVTATSSLMTAAPSTTNDLIFAGIFALAYAVVSAQMSALSSKGSRFFAVIGLVTGTAIMYWAYYLAKRITTGALPQFTASNPFVISLALSFILMISVVLAGAPSHSGPLASTADDSDNPYDEYSIDE